MLINLDVMKELGWDVKMDAYGKSLIIQPSAPDRRLEETLNTCYSEIKEGTGIDPARLEDIFIDFTDNLQWEQFIIAVKESKQ